MTSSDPLVAARLRGIGKCYHVYDRPIDRLKQFFVGDRKRLYREFWALRGIDLEVRRGETLGLVGVNGAGKSTLLQVLAGTIQATEGEVETQGRLTALLELGSGFHHEYTGRENVMLSGTILGLSRAEMTEKLEAILQFADIGEFVDRPVKTYSKGMLARLAFSVYAFLDPQIFIVDEALAVGDAPFRHKCNHRFEELQKNGVAILFVSHDAASMKHRCDRVAWIHRGQLQMVGDPNEVVDAYLAAVFHGVKPKALSSGEADGADQRDGSGHCRFVSQELLDAAGRPLTHLDVPGRVRLRVGVENRSLDPGSARLQTGWRLVNSKGLAIATTNTGLEGVTIDVPPIGQRTELEWELDIPELKAGNYAVTLMCSEIDGQGLPRLCDRIVSAFDLELTNDREIAGIVGVTSRVRSLGEDLDG